MLKNILRLYNRALVRQPILTQAFMTGVLFGTGDLIAQNIEEKENDNYTFKRTARMVIFGTIIAGPMLANWYRFLDKYVTINNPVKALLVRVALDQTFFAPCFIATFFSVQGVMEGLSRQEIKQKLETVFCFDNPPLLILSSFNNILTRYNTFKAYPNALLNNYKIWPAVQLINFRIVPLQHRTMVTNMVALGWNTYLSIENRRAQNHISL
ncbi:4074_t:CDS:2 [Ambispora leptoticha]|uniref:4074_t:CDS:1 n=1 Tax=Ambispora leptoticha TaxID=144679 RepID=A0A9N9FUH6_9GLOM|nr:4074_t:CDS:2 [Ambispora leptoticha]